MAEEDKPRPLIVSVEEKPVYIVNDYPMECPGEKCDIKKQFERPWKRCVVRLIGSTEGGPVGVLDQKEEFVIRSCEECRYNPAALAVIKELQAPKAATEPDSYTYHGRKIFAKIQGLTGLGPPSGPTGPPGAGMANFFKDFVMPGLVESITKKRSIYDRLLPISPARTAADIQKLREADKDHHRHIEAHLNEVQRLYNEQMAKMMENAAMGPKGTPGPLGPPRAPLPLTPGEAAIKKALDEAFSPSMYAVDFDPDPKDKENKDDDDDPPSWY